LELTICFSLRSFRYVLKHSSTMKWAAEDRKAKPDVTATKGSWPRSWIFATGKPLVQTGMLEMSWILKFFRLPTEKEAASTMTACSRCKKPMPRFHHHNVFSTASCCVKVGVGWGGVSACAQRGVLAAANSRAWPRR
jgi:hypothetical protein